jgi:2-polyprenyl-3-methyl-5-hydroxy-6-metoxy-1,4-benzoquinol methylase
MVERNCPLCGENAGRLYLLKHQLKLVRCDRCSMIYTNPVPAAFASGSYYDNSGADYYLSPTKLESDYAGVRFERELRFFRRHCASGSVLDVGCSSGGFLFQLGKKCPGAYDLTGTDISGPALDYAESRGVRVVRGDFLGQDSCGCRFDAVTFWAVLEHLVDPRAFLEKARSMLKPPGLVFVLVPNMQSLAARLLGARYRYIYPQHLNYFTKATLTKMVGPDFSVVEWRSMHFNPVVIWQDWRQGGAEISNAQRGDLLRRTTAYKQNPVLKPFKALYQLAEKALGAAILADNVALVLRRK